VPIYYGCQNVGEIYPPASFIEIDFNESIEKAVEQIVGVYHNDDYDSRLPHVLAAKDLYYTKYNIFNFLDKLITNGSL
jgi:hypothetical protein